MTTPRTAFAWANAPELSFVSIQILTELERLMPSTRRTTEKAINLILSHGFSDIDARLIFSHWRKKSKNPLPDSELDIIWEEMTRQEHAIQDSTEWPEPAPIIAAQESNDYPLESLPKPLHLLVEEIIGYVQCPVALAANAVLAALSLSIQGLVNVARDDFLTSPVSLFLMVIAESGERKSASDDMVIRDVKILNSERFCEDKENSKHYQTEHQIWMAKREGITNAIKQDAKKSGEDANNWDEQLRQLDREKPQKPRGTTFLYEDSTVEALLKGLYNDSPSGGIFSSEAGVVFGDHGMNKDNAMRNMASLNKQWDGDDIIIKRMDETKDMLLTGRRLTLCLATQESTVRAFFDNSKGLARGTGFGARFLIAWPKSTQGTRFYKKSPLLSYRAGFSSRITTLLNTPLSIDETTGALQPVTLQFSDEAKQAWIDFYNDTEAELRKGGELEEIKDVTSKAADNVARIAALFHVYEQGVTGTISKEHVISAGHIMLWHLLESKRFFSEVILPKELHRATMLDAWLIRQCKELGSNQISLMQTRQKCPNSLRGKGVIDEALNHLAELNRIKMVKDSQKKQIHLNPQLLEV